MSTKRLGWQEELEIIDRTMKAISDVSDPNELVRIYWTGIGELLPIGDYVALSRRGVPEPCYLITRASRFTERHNPWTQRDRLPCLTGGILGEIAYANRPIIMQDLPGRLEADDPGRFYLEGFQSLIALPQYDGGEALNTTVMLLPPGQELDPAIIPMMHWQAGLFGRGTQNLVLRNHLRDALAALDRELEIVGEIQRSLLPEALPVIDGFGLAADYQTSARAGGDYYDFFPLDHGGWGIFIADVSGHGTPAAVLMAITHAIAHSQPGTHVPPVELLGYLNHHLARSYSRNGSFVTAFYAVLEPQERKLTYARAGHEPPRLVRHSKVSALDANGALPLGISSDERYVQTELTLQAGDLLLLYTDGISEASGPRKNAAARELFGIERLDDVLLSCRSCTAAQCIDRIRAEVSAFGQGSPPVDDQTLIALRCLERGDGRSEPSRR